MEKEIKPNHIKGRDSFLSSKQSILVIAIINDGRDIKIHKSLFGPGLSSEANQNDIPLMISKVITPRRPFGKNMSYRGLRLTAEIAPLKKETIPLPILLVLGLVEKSLIVAPINIDRKNTKPRYFWKTVQMAANRQ